VHGFAGVTEADFTEAAAEVREHGVDLVTRGLALEFDARAAVKPLSSRLAEEVDLDVLLNT